MPHRALIVCVCCTAIGLLAAVNVRASQSDRPAAVVSGMVSTDARTRESARRALLNLEAAQLEDLAEIVRSLPPEQRGLPELQLAVREAVDHIFLRDAKEQYLSAFEGRNLIGAPRSFLGIVWRSERFRNVSIDTGPGIPVARCLPGFNAYEALQEGDVILGIEVGDRIVDVANVIELNRVIEAYAPGSRIQMRVLRTGTLQNVSFTLDARVDTEDPAFIALNRQAIQAADLIWQGQLLPALQGQDPATDDGESPATRPANTSVSAL